MSKNIILCCDGTNNVFGSKNTNVVRLFQSLELWKTTFGWMIAEATTAGANPLPPSGNNSEQLGIVLENRAAEDTPTWPLQ